MVPQIPILPTLLSRPRPTIPPSPSRRRLRQHSPPQPATSEPRPRRPTPIRSSPNLSVRQSTRPPSPPTLQLRLPDPLPPPPRRNRPRLPRRPTRLFRRRLGHGRGPIARTRASELPICRQERGLGEREEGLRYAAVGDGALYAAAAGAHHRGD